MMNCWVGKNISESQTEVKTGIQKERRLDLCLTMPLGNIQSVAKDVFGYFDNIIQDKISSLKFISNLNSIALKIQIYNCVRTKHF